MKNIPQLFLGNETTIDLISINLFHRLFIFRHRIPSIDETLIRIIIRLSWTQTSGSKPHLLMELFSQLDVSCSVSDNCSDWLRVRRSDRREFDNYECLWLLIIHRRFCLFFSVGFTTTDVNTSSLIRNILIIMMENYNIDRNISVTISILHRLHQT